MIIFCITYTIGIFLLVADSQADYREAIFSVIFYIIVQFFELYRIGSWSFLTFERLIKHCDSNFIFSDGSDCNVNNVMPFYSKETFFYFAKARV